MSGPVRDYSDSTFANEVEGADGITLVDFWAAWCAPCRMLSPTVAQLAEENKGAVNVGKVNVDENPGTAAKYGIRGIPTLLFFKDGRVAGQLVGVHSKEEIQKAIDRLD